MKTFLLPFQAVVHGSSCGFFCLFWVVGFFLIFFFFCDGITESLVLPCLQTNKDTYAIYNICSENGPSGEFQC